MIARRNLCFTLAVLVLVLSACTPAIPVQPTPAPTSIPVEPTQPLAVDTATLEPTATLPPTATLLPTPTVAPPSATPATRAGLASSWCILRDDAASVKTGADPAVMPEGARAGIQANGVLTLLTPSASCTLVFNLPGSPAEGSVLEVMDGSNAVWLKVPLQVSPSDPNLKYAVLTHAYAVEPPFWTIFYPVSLKAADGKELWKTQMEMRLFWQPEKCWDGTMPDFKTLYCKKNQDLHPWDPAYTPPPPEPKQ